MLSLLGSILDLLSIVAITILMKSITSFSQPVSERNVNYPDIILKYFGSNEVMILTFATVIIAASILVRYIININGIRIGNNIDLNLSKRLLHACLYTSYEKLKQKSVADYSAKLTSDVGRFCQGVILPAMNLPYLSMSTFLITLFAIISVGWKFLWLSLSIATVLYFIFKLRKNFLIDIGSERLRKNEARYNLFMDAINGMAEVKTYKLQHRYFNDYSKLHASIVESEVKSQVISTTPRYFIEAFVFASFGCAVISMSIFPNFASEAYEIIIFISASLLRLAPNLNAIYSTFTTVYFNKANVTSLAKQFLEMQTNQLEHKDDQIYTNFEPEAYGLIDVSFRYRLSDQFILNNVSIIFNRGENVAIKGSTGSGKSTLVEILLNLLSPSSGVNSLARKIEDGDLTVGYVPQFPSFPNCNIYEAISLKNDLSRSEEALIHEIIDEMSLTSAIDALPDGFQTTLTNNANVLSGGQKQRLAIARALFLNADMVIYDECTSALNAEMEQLIISKIINRTKGKINIFSTHSKELIECCDRVVTLSAGKLI